MKKFILITALIFSVSMFAETNGVIVSKQGVAMKAEILKISQNEVFYILPKTKQISVMSAEDVQRITIQKLDIRVKDKQFYDFRNKIYTPAGGLFYVNQSKEEIVNNWQLNQISVDKQNNNVPQKTLPADPNQTIGRAMICAGGVSLGFGLPCLISGTVLGICSQFYLDSDKDLSIAKLSDKKSAMALSGCMLGGAGIALCVVSIPLIVEGQKIVDLSFQLNENGAGLAIQF